MYNLYKIDKMKKVKLIVACMLLCSFVQAQTAGWLVKPEYKEIKHYSKDVFKCVDINGHIQLIDWEGRNLLGGVVADTVTDYSDGYAVVLEGNRIKGFLAENSHDFIIVNGDFVATKYSYFSEGYIVVAEDGINGKQGYLDTMGKIFIECKYLEAMPFRHGWAAVKRDGKDARVKYYAYIPSDKSKEEQIGIVGLGGGKENIYKASSFNDEGVALVYGKDKNYYLINSSMKIIKQVSVTGFSSQMNSYDYSYKSSKSAEVKAPINDKSLEINQDIVVFSENQIFGFRTKTGKTILPLQFEDAQPFYAGLAIVEKGGSYGILKLLNGSFEVKWPAENIRSYPDGKCNKSHLELAPPSSLNHDMVVLDFDCGDGTYKNNIPFVYDFLPLFQTNAKQCEIKGKALCDELLLWEEGEKIAIDYITIDIKSPVVTTVYANEEGNQTVKAVITNTSEVDVEVDANLKVDGRVVPFKGKLASKQSKTLAITLKVDENKTIQATISVKAEEHDCGSKSSRLSLKKI